MVFFRNLPTLVLRSKTWEKQISTETRPTPQKSPKRFTTHFDPIKVPIFHPSKTTLLRKAWTEKIDTPFGVTNMIKKTLSCCRDTPPNNCRSFSNKRTYLSKCDYLTCLFNSLVQFKMTSLNFLSFSCLD